MDYNNMDLDQLKTYAKSIGLQFGNIGKEKLIDKIKEYEGKNDVVKSVIEDNDLEVSQEDIQENIETQKNTTNMSLIDSISNAIDELEDADKKTEFIVETLPIDTPIPVKSITFGGLTYKSRSTGSITRWNQIGAIEYMTIAELNEMNNHKRYFLNEPKVILLDERAINHFRLTSVYENVAKINDLKRIYRSDMNTIKSTIKTAIDVGMRDVLISKSSQMIKNKTLTDINVIRLISRELQYDFEDILEH